MSLTLDLTDRVVLVTGGARGIGLGVSRVLASAGATVVSCGRSEAEPPVPGGSHLVCDVRDADAVTVMVDELVSSHGRLDGLVNNAGGAPYSPAAEASPRLHEKVVGLNLLAPLVVAQACHAVMQSQERGGSIVNISSVSALRGMRKTITTYAATKAGVAHLAEGLRMELLGKPIKVTVIYPGYIASEMNEGIAGDQPMMASTEKGVQAIVSAIEKEKASACVPPLPWAPLSVVMKHAPLPVLKRLI